MTMPPDAPLSGFEPLRTEAEREALDAGTRYAATHDLASPPETAYLDALGPARRDVLLRFVRGILRGNPDGLADPIVEPISAGTPRLPDEPPPFSELDWADVLAGTAVPDATAALALLALPASGAVLAVPVDAVHGYDRFRPSGPVTVCTPRSGTRVSHPVDLAWLLAREGAFVDAEQAERISAEVSESVANLALARLAERVQSRREPPGPVLDAPADSLPAADRASALERRVTGGHPFHPCAKIRRGMTPTAGLTYATEFTATIDLRFVAVRNDCALRSRASDGEPSLTRRLFETFDGLESAVHAALPGVPVDDYAVIPVHPWQYHHVLPERYADPRAEQHADPRTEQHADPPADGHVVPLSYTAPATPLLNFRTVVPQATGIDGEGRGPAHDKHPPHCKLAVGVQLTNVERTLSPQAVHNGPRVTALLRHIADRESLSRVGVLDEFAAACYYPPGGPHLDGETFDDVRNLSGLVRQNPYAHPFATDGAHLVPAASLPADVGTGRPLARELVERYAEATDTTDTEAAALEFLGEYAGVVVPEHLVLQCKYGVALESHLQNALAVVEDGRPTAVLVRDFGGVRVHAERLADHGLALDTYPDSDVDADGREDLYRKLYYALFQNHLAELIVALVETTPVEEAACWSRVAERCRETFEDLRTDPAVPADRVDRDEAALFADPAVHKALTTMRLRGKRHEYVTSRVSNPLAPFGRR